MLADEVDFVVGVDTHRDWHSLAVVEVRNGAVVDETRVPTNSGGYAEALRFAEQLGVGRRAFAVEGTGSYGAGLARFLADRGERVLEVGFVRRESRSAGKTDALEAVRAARSVLANKRPTTPRSSSGEREALRTLTAAREGAVNANGLGSASCAICSSPRPNRCAASFACSREPVSFAAWSRLALSAVRTRCCAGHCSRCGQSLVECKA